MTITSTAKIALFLAIGAASAAAWQHLSGRPPSGQFGKDPAATQWVLKGLSSRVEDAIDRGDVSEAKALMDESTRLLRILNDGDDASAQMHNCRLAAVHLGAGTISLVDGTSWSSRPQFKSALKACGG